MITNINYQQSVGHNFMINYQAQLLLEARRPTILLTKTSNQVSLSAIFSAMKKDKKKPWQNAMLLLDSLGVVPDTRLSTQIRLAV